MSGIITQLKKKVQEIFPYKKRKAIQDWDFILVFQEYYQEEIEMILQSIKCRQSMKWTLIKHKEEKKSLFLLKLQDNVVIDMAHQLKILKKKQKKSYKLSLKDLNSTIYTMGNHHPTNAYNYLCYIRARLYPKNREIYEQEQYSAFNKNKIHQYIPINDKGQLFTEEEKLRTKYHFLLTYSEVIGGNSEVGKQYQKQVREPFSQLMKHPGFVEIVPIQKVSQHRPLIFGSLRDYLGPNVDCYFDFVQFLQKWLWFPMIVGLITAGTNYYYEFTVDNSPVDFIYAWAVMIWSILFITRWEQIQAWQKVKQTPGYSEIWSEHQEIVSRRGMEKHISSVTGRAQYDLSLKDRIMLRFASQAVFVSITLITMVFMVLSLNLRGFIDPEHKLFYSESLSSLAAPGGIFDANTFWGQIPNILHVIITNGFDQMVYRPLAKKLAKFERHRTTKGYENSIIIKYFIYEFLITFADLFYIAFVRFDIEGLRQQLFSLFFIDIVRRVVAQSLIPWLKKTHRSKTLQKNYETSKQKMSYEDELQKGAFLEIDKQPYEQFDDYLEIITNFGYLVMISSCFPMAPLLIIIAHQVEIWQDRYKIVHILRRKLPQQYVGMGRWKNIMVFLCYISIITNIMLFAFSSEQVSSIFPKMYEGSKDLIYGNTDLETLFGGAATSVFQSMINIGDQATSGFVNANSGGWDLNPFDQQSPQTSYWDVKVDENKNQGNVEPSLDLLNGLGGLGQKKQNSKFNDVQLANLLGLQPKDVDDQPESTFQLHNFHAPDKESEVTFIAVLFFIEHFFLILFIVMRDMLKKRKSQADIFLERRAYKRKIKKNLPKDVLALVTAGMLINKYFKDEDQKQGSSILGKLIGNLSQGSENSGNMNTQKGNEAGKESKEEPKMSKQDSQMSGDTFLMGENEDNRQEIRDILLSGVMKKKQQ